MNGNLKGGSPHERGVPVQSGFGARSANQKFEWSAESCFRRFRPERRAVNQNSAVAQSAEVKFICSAEGGILRGKGHP